MRGDGTKMSRPLDGVRVLDLAHGGLAAVGRTLAELGADVVRVAFASADAERHAAPTVNGVGLDFAIGALGKRNVALDAAQPDSAKILDALCAGADLLIETTHPGTPEHGIVDAARRRAENPGLVVLSVPDFAAGPFGEWRASDGVLHALCATLARSGLPGHAPLLPPGELAIQCAATQVSYAAMIAYYNRLRTGDGDHVVVPLIEAALVALDPGYGMAGSAAGASLASQLPRGRPDYLRRYPIVPCADGFVRLCILAPRQWRSLFNWIGKPAEFADPRFEALEARFGSDALIPFLAKTFAGRSRTDLERDGQKHGVPIAAVLTLDEALENEHADARRSVVDVEIAPGFTTDVPNGMVVIDGARMGVRGPPPAPRGDVQAVLESWAAPREELRPTGSGDRPLDGIRVLDLGVIVVGGEQGRLLADFGADVVKVEHSAFLDGSRRAGSGVTVSFSAGNRNKQSLGLDLRSPRGREIFLDLVRKSDVVLTNFKPGTLDSLGLSPDTLLAANPRLIVVDSSAYGSSGPWSERMGYGPLLRAGSGLSRLWVYPDDDTKFCDMITVYPDHVAARVGAVSVVALLARRLRTGRGGQISISQTEVILSHLSRQIAERGLRLRETPASIGDAPWPPFPCAGDDEWCVVGCRDDAELRALANLIGAEAAKDARLVERLGAWLRERAPHEAMETLQAAGVPAGAMLRVSELPDFAYFRDGDVFQLLNQRQIADPVVVDNMPLRSVRLARPPLRPAPDYAEHTAEVVRRILHLDDKTIEALLAERVLEAAATP
jgi:crotonobetainyl-CoA:carnitine CoA-transferase CaiB-like acyl-CoA transferase